MFQILGDISSLVCKEEAVIIIPNRLLWVCNDRSFRRIKSNYILQVDDVYEYNPFNFDFGPLDISSILTFTKELQYILKNPSNSSSIILHQCGQTVAKKSNSALLICAFMILNQNKSAEEAWKHLECGLNQIIIPFRDCLPHQQSSFNCTVFDCLKGIEEANKRSWINQTLFNHFQYDQLGRVDNGDVTQIVPNKFIAFRSPKDLPQEGVKVGTPSEYSEIFQTLNVKKVIQLNKEKYDTSPFTSKGIDHVKIVFKDGGNPNDDQIEQFMSEVKSTEGIVAVHCQAGLGRTGTMIALYCMKYYQFPVIPLIAYLKMIRPGSIHGDQHQFLIVSRDLLKIINKINFVKKKENEYLPVETQKLLVKYKTSHKLGEIPDMPSNIDEFDELDWS